MKYEGPTYHQAGLDAILRLSIHNFINSHPGCVDINPQAIKPLLYFSLSKTLVQSYLNKLSDKGLRQ